ncbi:MAG TPA: hypothetical protein VF708_19125 [Pyrinomonadaceae bacterium]
MSAPAPAQQKTSVSMTTVNITAKSDGVLVVAEGDVAELRLEVIDASGEVVYETPSYYTQELSWDMHDARGLPVPAGHYMCTVTFKDSSGKIRKRIEQVTVKEVVTPETVAPPTAQAAAEQAATDITSVIHDSTLSGDGTTLSPLKVTMPLQSDLTGNVNLGIPGQRVRLPSDTSLQLGADAVGRGSLRFPTIYKGTEFSIDVSEQYPGDPVLSIGYNASAGSLINPREPAIYHTIEGNYRHPLTGIRYFEMNTEVNTTDGRHHRLQAFSARRSDLGQVSWMWAGDDFRLLPTGELDATGHARPFFWASVSSNLGIMQGSWGIGVSSPTGLTPMNRVVIPNGSYYAGLNSSSTGSMSLIGVSDNNRIRIAPGGQQTSIGGKLLIGADQATSAALTIYGAPGSRDGQRIRIGQSPEVDYSIGREPLNNKFTFVAPKGTTSVGYAFDAEVEAKSISLGGGVTWTKGVGAPNLPCKTGSLYTNQTGGAYNTLYVCAAGVWMAK